MSAYPQDSNTRNLLARVDLAIIEIDRLSRDALVIQKQLDDLVRDLSLAGTSLEAARSKLRPILDSSAPVAFPYDGQQQRVHAWGNWLREREQA